VLDEYVYLLKMQTKQKTREQINIIMHTHIQVFIRLRRSRTPHLATKLNLAYSQLLTTSQHHSPTRILPRNHTNIRNTPTQRLPIRLPYGLVC